MTRSNLFRTIFVAALAASFVPVAAFCQSDTQSVAEAARRAREKKEEKKKDSAKPVKVITDDTLDVKKGDIQSATAELPQIPGAANANAPAAPTANSSAGAKGAQDEKLKRELDNAKEQLKQALSDLDLLQRENRLDQDAYYSKPDYASDAAGKQKLDDEKQAISDKR
ncbi:MAG TPA: hypothetical protein VFI60_11785, partial [Candidatus Acidoferrum sp.]|nr:hypothetical protein [Candidatus Acidoferrum sp.]